jgi:hypothetical protein
MKSVLRKDISLRQLQVLGSLCEESRIQKIRAMTSVLCRGYFTRGSKLS